ncbi:MAG: hypothetical protein V1922_02060 [bacterium]
MIKNEPGVKNFWNGFLAGGAVAGLMLYAFGTKNGRNGLRTLLSFSEDLDTNVHKIFSHTQPTNSKKTTKNQGSMLDTVTTILDKIQYASKRA